MQSILRITPCVEGLRLGDVGILKYQGKNGVEFKKDGSNVADKENRYYHFGFNRK